MSTIRVNEIQTTAGAPNRGRVLAVYYTKSSDVQTITSNSPVPISGLSLTVTPASNTSRFLITGGTMFSGNGTYANNRVHVVRNGNTSLIEMACYEMDYANQSAVDKTCISVLDTPATASNITYALYAVASNNAGGLYLNRINTSATNQIFGMGATNINSENGSGHSWIQVMELAAA